MIPFVVVAFIFGLGGGFVIGARYVDSCWENLVNK